MCLTRAAWPYVPFHKLKDVNALVRAAGGDEAVRGPCETKQITWMCFPPTARDSLLSDFLLVVSVPIRFSRRRRGLLFAQHAFYQAAAAG